MTRAVLRRALVVLGCALLCSGVAAPATARQPSTTVRGEGSAVARPAGQLVARSSAALGSSRRAVVRRGPDLTSSSPVQRAAPRAAYPGTGAATGAAAQPSVSTAVSAPAAVPAPAANSAPPTSGAPAASVGGVTQVAAGSGSPPIPGSGSSAPANRSTTGALGRLLSVPAIPSSARSGRLPTSASAPASQHAPVLAQGGAAALPRGSGSPSPAERSIVHAVPAGVWFALAGLTALVVAFGGAAAVATRTSRRRGRLLDQATDMALTDSLTGLLSRRGIERGLAAELARAQRYRHPLSLVFFDVEGLKAVNDAHGHGAGDRVLAAVGSLLGEVSRDHDLCGRLGGDESVVVLPEQDRAGAFAFRDRVLERLPAYQAALGLSIPWGLTAGVACHPADGQTPEDLLATADRRLYEHRGIDITPVS